MNVIKMTLFKISASKAHKEYQQLKTLQLAHFFKISLAIIIFSIIYFIVPVVIQMDPSNLLWPFGILLLCLLSWFFCDRLKKYLDIILFIACIALFANAYYGIYSMASSITPGTFVLGFAIGHTSGTFEKILGLRFSNFYYKIAFYLILLVIRIILIHQVSTVVQIYHVYIIIMGLIVVSQKEKEDRTLFQGFYDYRESLTKFKNLVSSGLSANLLILTRDLKQELFISEPLAEMARNNGQKEEIPNVFQWLDQLIMDSSQQSALDVLRSPFLKSQDKLTFNAKIHENGAQKIFEIKIFGTIWGDKDALVLILNDITNHYLNMNLQAADRNKDKMLAMISHELRTPLNGILGVVNILKKDIKDPQQLRYLTVCHNSGELLLNLVNSILDLQQIRDKKFALNHTKENLYELLGGIYDLFKFQFDQKGLEFKLEISSEVPEQIITDKNRLKQILINLIGNALKFTFKGGVNVSVDIDPVFDDSIHLRVSDTGIGIKEEDLQKLFKMYGRLDQQDTKTNTQGVGLGLEISNQLALLLAGEQPTGGIRVESQVGEGTTFSFSIRDNFYAEEGHEINYYEPRVFSENTEDIGLKITPYSQKDIFCNALPITSISKGHTPSVSLFSSQKLSDLANPPIISTKKLYRSYNNLYRSRDCFSPKRSSRKENNISAKSKILLVDDNPFNLLVARQLVERLGYNVETALNGELAIKQVKKQCFCAILMDLQMPVMDGYETTKELRKMMNNKEIPEIPIIAVSANDTEDDKKRCKEIGMYEHLSKPLDEDLLRKVLDKALEKEAVEVTFEDPDEAH